MNDRSSIDTSERIIRTSTNSFIEFRWSRHEIPIGKTLTGVFIRYLISGKTIRTLLPKILLQSELTLANLFPKESERVPKPFLTVTFRLPAVAGYYDSRSAFAHSEPPSMVGYISTSRESARASCRYEDRDTGRSVIRARRGGFAVTIIHPKEAFLRTLAHSIARVMVNETRSSSLDVSVSAREELPKAPITITRLETGLCYRYSYYPKLMHTISLMDIIS